MTHNYGPLTTDNGRFSKMDLEKYSRQVLFQPIGAEGQEKLLGAKAVIIGCGALGTTQANALARAGGGALRIGDRDYVEPSNLQRPKPVHGAELAEDASR